MNSIDELQKALKQYVESLKQTRVSRRSREYTIEILYRGLKEYVRSQPDGPNASELMNDYVEEVLGLNSEDRVLRYQLKKAFRKLSRERSRGDPRYQLKIDQFQGA